MTINCIIVDDEPLAREGIENYISNISFFHLVRTCENAMQAMTLLSQESVDLMFLDIQMPNLTGINFLKTLKNPPMVIITTAYPNYAIEGYQLDVLDYLVKPISFERFLKASNKSLDYFTIKQKALRSNIKTQDDYFFIKSEGRYEKIRFEDILLIEGLENYIIIHTPEKKYLSLIPMKSMEGQLPTDAFIRVQKSFIVPLSKIDSIEGNMLKIGKHSVTIARHNKEKIIDQIIKLRLIRK